MPFDNVSLRQPDPQCIELLDRTERLLRHERKWTKRTAYRGMWWWRSYCMDGALMYAAHKQHCPDYKIALVRHTLNHVAQRHGHETFVGLNDALLTTHQLVLTVLREARNDLEFQHAVTP